MNKYLINALDSNKFKAIITLLDFETRISDGLKSIKFSSLENEKILIDTALVAGMNEYRFIEAQINENGQVCLAKYSYVDVDFEILQRANLILSNTPKAIDSSILTINQKKYLKVRS